MQSELIRVISNTYYDEIPLLGSLGEISDALDVSGLPEYCVPKTAIMMLAQDSVKLLIKKGEQWETIYSKKIGSVKPHETT